LGDGGGGALGLTPVGPLVTIAMLPACTLRAAALAHIQASDVVDFLNDELASHALNSLGTHALNWTKLPGWLEQPAYPSTSAGDPGAIIAATRIEPLPPIMNQLFNVEAPPLQPSTSVVESRRSRTPDDESVLQRARMTDSVAGVWKKWQGERSTPDRPTSIQVTITYGAL